MLSVVTEAMKKSVMFLCVHLSKIFVWYTATGLYITLHNPPARLDGIHPVEIRLIGIRIIEVFFFFFFLRKYMRILSGHWKLSVTERCPYLEVRLPNS